MRWTLETLDASESYTFEINPNSTRIPVLERSITWTATRAGFTGARASRAPIEWQFAGVVRSQEQYAAFIEWVTKDERVKVRTHLGQVYEVRLTGFTPESGGRKQAPWRHTYVLSALVYQELS